MLFPLLPSSITTYSRRSAPRHFRLLSLNDPSIVPILFFYIFLAVGWYWRLENDQNRTGGVIASLFAFIEFFVSYR